MKTSSLFVETWLTQRVGYVNIYSNHVGCVNLMFQHVLEAYGQETPSKNKTFSSCQNNCPASEIYFFYFLSIQNHLYTLVTISFTKISTQTRISSSSFGRSNVVCFHYFLLFIHNQLKSYKEIYLVVVALR